MSAPPGAPDAPTVLVVDDDPDLRDAIAEYLRAFRFDVLEASNGLEALVHAKRVRPRAVVLDLSMPRLDGLETLRRLRAFDPSATYVVVTGVEDPSMRARARALGVATVLPKPLDFGALAAMLRAVVARPPDAVLLDAPSGAP